MLPPQYKKESSYFCRFTFGQFFTLLILEIFTLFFIFYMGARYGGELLGVKSPVSAAPGDPSLPKVLATDPNVVATTQDPEIRALAKNLMESTQTPDLKQRVADMLKESGAYSPPAAPKEPAAVAEPAVKTAPAAPGATKPEPVIKTAPNARFSVQVGSFPNSDEAHTMVAYWKARGEEAYMVSAEIPGRGRWYRVRLGAFDSKEAAASYLQTLQAEEKIEGFVVTNE